MTAKRSSLTCGFNPHYQDRDWTSVTAEYNLMLPEGEPGVACRGASARVGEAALNRVHREMLPMTVASPRPDLLLEGCCLVHGIEKEDMIGRSNRPAVLRARYLFVGAAREWTQMSWKDIASMMNRRSHTTPHYVFERWTEILPKERIRQMRLLENILEGVEVVIPASGPENVLIRLIEETFGLDIDELRGTRRTKRFVRARWAWIYVLRRGFGYSYCHIGDIVHCHHTSASNAVRGVRRLKMVEPQTFAVPLKNIFDMLWEWTDGATA